MLDVWLGIAGFFGLVIGYFCGIMTGIYLLKDDEPPQGGDER